jgi:hypothetical protein
MSETVTHIVAEGGSRVANAPARPAAQPAPPVAETRPAAPGRPAGWIPVVTPGTTAVVIALVSKHGVIATVPANASQQTKAVAVARHEVDVRT